MLYASPQGLESIKSLGHYFNPSSTLEDKLGLAGSNYELTAAIPSVVSYLSNQNSWSAIEKHEGELKSYLLTYLNSRSDITIFGEKESDTKKRVSTISFVVKGRKSQDVVEEIDEVSGGEMGIRWGGFYSVRWIGEVLGLDKKDGVVRVSMVHYNTCKFTFHVWGLKRWLLTD
jgi:selenocysteine lyase/cysteine desulfurase